MKKTILALSLLVGMSSTASVFAALPQSIRIGTDATYAPFSSKDAKGDFVGFDIDLGNEMCKRLKAKCEWVESDFDGLIPSLKAKKIDAILSAMSITDQRKQEIDFTNKLYGTPARLVAAKGSGIQPTAEALQGKRVGVMQGTTAETYAKDNWQAKGVELVPYQNQDLVYADLVSGRIDAAFQDAVTAGESFLNKPQGEQFEYAGAEINDVKYFGVGAGIGVRKEDGALKDALNKTLADMRKDGTYDKLAKKYFKFNIYGE